MARLLLEGEIIEVLPVTEVGENKTKKQSVIVKVPGFKDDWSGREGRAEFWQMDALGDKIEQLKLSKDLEGKTGIFKCFINSNLVITKDKTNIYPVNVALASFEITSK